MMRSFLVAVALGLLSAFAFQPVGWWPLMIAAIAILAALLVRQATLGRALLVGWGFGDFIFHTETDVISDVNKIYRYGFTERMDSTQSLLAALDSLKGRRILP